MLPELQGGNMSTAATIAIPMGYPPGPIHAFSRGLDPQTTSHTAPTVFIVDDDIDVRQSLELLIRSQGWQPQVCDSAREFLAQPRSLVPSCMILAFSSTDSDGLEMQKKIARECAEMPVIVIADYGDTRTTVQAMKAGAVDFLLKPCSAELLVAAIRQSLVRSRASLDRCKE
jgi:FixJ family two-component response regulator